MRGLFCCCTGAEELSDPLLGQGPSVPAPRQPSSLTPFSAAVRLQAAARRRIAVHHAEALARLPAAYECSGVQVFNSFLQAVLPLVRRSIGKKLLALNRSGGMPLGAHSAKQRPLYRLRVQRRVGGGEVREDEVVERLRIQLRSLHAWEKPKEVATSTRGGSAGCRSGKAPQRRRVGHTSAAASASTSDRSHMDLHENQVLIMDVEVLVELGFGCDELAFKLHGERWWTPPLGDATIQDLRVQARNRIWYDTLRGKLKVAFLEEPKVDWDAEVRLLGCALPDAIEDKLLPWTVQKYLASITTKNPLKLNVGLSDSQVVQKAGGKQVVRVGVEFESDSAKDGAAASAEAEPSQRLKQADSEDDG